MRLVLVQADEPGPREELYLGEAQLAVPTPDGRAVRFCAQAAPGQWDIWRLPLDGSSKPEPFLVTRERELLPSFSPDGRFVAYHSDDSGRPEVYVQPFPGPGEKRRISVAGGSLPRWRRDGRELFYLGADTQLMAVPIRLGSSAEPGTPSALFAIEAAQNVMTEYDVSRDGQRFLVNSPVPGAAAAPIVVLNWTADLPR